MKKFIILLLAVLPFVSKAQETPQRGFQTYQSISKPYVLYHFQGAIIGDSGLVIQNFADSNVLGVDQISNTDGSLVTFDHIPYIRELGGWHILGGGDNSLNIYNGDGKIITGTVGGQRTIYGDSNNLYFDSIPIYNIQTANFQLESYTYSTFLSATPSQFLVNTPSISLTALGGVGMNLETDAPLSINGISGTSGYFLKTQGAGLPPIWASIGSSGTDNLDTILARGGNISANRASNFSGFQWEIDSLGSLIFQTDFMRIESLDGTCKFEMTNTGSVWQAIDGLDISETDITGATFTATHGTMFVKGQEGFTLRDSISKIISDIAGGGKITVTAPTFKVNSDTAVSLTSTGSANLTIDQTGIKTDQVTNAIISADVNGYLQPVNLTTTGSSGPATFTSGTLNIPQYSGGSGQNFANTDLVQTGNRYYDAARYDLTIDSVENWQLTADSSFGENSNGDVDIAAATTDIGHGDGIFENGHGGSSVQVLYNGAVSIASGLHNQLSLYGDSDIVLDPHLGNILANNIDSLTDSTNYKPLMYDVANHKIIRSNYWYGGSGGGGGAYWPLTGNAFLTGNTFIDGGSSYNLSLNNIYNDSVTAVNQIHFSTYGNLGYLDINNTGRVILSSDDGIFINETAPYGPVQLTSDGGNSYFYMGGGGTIQLTDYQHTTIGAMGRGYYTGIMDIYGDSLNVSGNASNTYGVITGSPVNKTLTITSEDLSKVITIGDKGIKTNWLKNNSSFDSCLAVDTSGELIQVARGAIRYNHTIFTPTTGTTVNLVNKQYNIINPSGALLALTVNLPSSPANNDVVYIKFTQTISTVTYTGGTVVDGITAPTAGGLIVLTYDSSTTSWY